MTATTGLLMGMAALLGITAVAAALAHARRRHILERSAERARRSGDLARRSGRYLHRPPRPRQGDPPA